MGQFSKAFLTMRKIEILAPAGSKEAVISAVRSGADAVYLGLKDFSARKEAQNFSFEDLKETTAYCHIRGVKVYVTMNTLIFDSELQSALETVKKACECNIDALIVQDIGFANLVHKACPKLPLHGSTQMSVHTLCGAKFLKEMGFKRVVLSREMSREEIKHIADNCDIELEVFVHGALCMSVSGQCYFSAMLGGRSGNRGYCAQTCRLPFKVEGCDHALSLKDNSIIYYLDNMAEIGVTSAKIEGRMKRPEYVSSAVSACYEKREKGFVSVATMENLKKVFSRTGFTSNYYTGNLGKEMFGYRQREDVVSATEKLFKEIRQNYKDERQSVPLSGVFKGKTGGYPVFKITDGTNSVEIVGDALTETALKVPLTEEKIKDQMTKTGGTPYFFEDIKVEIEENISIPVSSLNKMRRAGVSKISDERDISYHYKFSMPPLDFTPANQHICEKRGEVKKVDENISMDYSMVFVPIDTDEKDVNFLTSRGQTVGISVPRGMFGREEKIIESLKQWKSKGIRHILCNNLGAVYFGKKLGFTVHGGEFLNITNTASVMWAEEYGLQDILVSIEITDKQINALGGNIKRGVVSYGYIPLMLTRNCPVKSGNRDCKSCKKSGKMQDRKNYEFSLFCDGTVTEVLNTVPVNILQEINKKFSTYFTMEKFYVENYVEKVENYGENNSNSLSKPKYTRGMYYRGVK